ncbi:MAG: helix-turn-helix domain-containing protein [Planctomycetota bacterium]
MFPLALPPLRERAAELPALCAALLEEQAARTGRRGLRVSAAGLELLGRYPWPGNVRELANVLERAAILAPGRELGAAELAPALGPAAAPTSSAAPPSEVLTLDEAQRRAIRQALAATGGRIRGEGGAAELLGINASTLQSRMKKLGVTRLA